MDYKSENGKRDNPNVQPFAGRLRTAPTRYCCGREIKMRRNEDFPASETFNNPPLPWRQSKERDLTVVVQRSFCELNVNRVPY